MQLREAVGERVKELIEAQNITTYQLYKRSGVPKSTISNILHGTYGSVTLRIIHELCQGLDISIAKFFDSPLFDENNLDP